jgi:hypothetical protein
VKAAAAGKKERLQKRLFRSRKFDDHDIQVLGRTCSSERALFCKRAVYSMKKRKGSEKRKDEEAL